MADTRLRRMTKRARAQALDVLESVLVAAKAGDMQACKIILDRVWPTPRSGAVEVPLRATRSVADVRDAMHELLGRMAAGEVALADGRDFIAIMKEIVMVHTAETLPFSGPPLQISDARQSLQDRIQKAIAAREARGGNHTIEIHPSE